MNREAEEERLHELHFDLPQRLKEITVCARRATVVFDVCMYCECEFVVSKLLRQAMNHHVTWTTGELAVPRAMKQQHRIGKVGALLQLLLHYKACPRLQCREAKASLLPAA